jgi:hypothetical protein
LRRPRDASAGAVAEALASLRARLPSLPEIAPAAPDAVEKETLGQLRLLVRDSGRELKRLRRLPRSETAPIARFREACRSALAAVRALDRARRKMAAARKKL